MDRQCCNRHRSRNRPGLYNRDSPVILDIQCFKDNNSKFIVKEASVLEVDTGTLLLHHIAQAPYARDVLTQDKLRESYWMSKHCHGLEWDQGDIPYHVLLDKLRSCLANRTLIYVKGVEKQDFVYQNLLTPAYGYADTEVVDMMDIGCGSLASIGNILSHNVLRCGRHKNTTTRCALANCTLLRSWLLLTAKEEVYKKCATRSSSPSSLTVEYGEDETDL